MKQRVLCIWLPNWPLQRVLAAEPAIVGRAVVLEARDARRGLTIAALNLAARRAGACVGMRMSELAALCSGPDGSHRPNATSSSSSSAPSAAGVLARAGASASARGGSSTGSLPLQELLWEVRPYQPEEDLDALCNLAEQAQQFSPLVGLELHDDRPWFGRSSCQPQSLLLDVSGIPHLFGGDDPFLVEVAAWLRAQRYFGYLSIASTTGCAWAMANYEISRRRKSATDGCNLSLPCPDPLSAARSTVSSTPVSSPGADYVPESRFLVTELWEEAELLSNLPVAALRIDEETVRKLERLGVKTLCQLWQLPRDGLASRLGSRLMHRSDQALGTAAEAVIALHGAPDWTLEFSLEHPTLAQATLAEVLRELCTGLSQRLSAKGRGALRCLCRLDCVRCPPLVMQLGLFRASDNANHLHSLLVGQLEQVLQRCQETGPVAKQPNAKNLSQSKAALSASGKSDGPLAIDNQGAVWRVSLQATLTGPIVWEQTQLFDEGDRKSRQQLAQLIDTLSGRLGRGQVLEARIERDAEPEQAVSYKPLTGRRNDGVEQQTIRKLNSRLAGSGAEPKPTDPLRRPTRLLEPAELLMGVNESSAGPPVEFVYENRRERVVNHWGPERLESGWWRGPSMRRDYYRIETASGQWWWIFRDMASGHWYVHGLFG